MESSFVIIKPNAIGESEEIIQFIKNLGLEIKNMKGIISTEDQWDQHYAHHRNRDKHKYIIKSLAGKYILALHVTGEGATDKLNHHKRKMRSIWAINKIHNGIHISDDSVAALKEMKIWGLKNL